MASGNDLLAPVPASNTEASLQTVARRRRLLGRRLSERMTVLGITDIDGYAALLRTSPDEAAALAHTLSDTGALLCVPPPYGLSGSKVSFVDVGRSDGLAAATDRSLDHATASCHDETLEGLRAELSSTLTKLGQVRQQLATANQELISASIELEQTEETLRSERNFLAAVVSTVSALVVVLDAHGHIVRFNRACEKASGYAFEDVAGKELRELELFAAEDMDAMDRDLVALRSGGPCPIPSERSWRHRDGTTRLINWSTTALADGSGTAEFVIATGIEVTEQRRAEDQARLRLLELTTLHRLHTVGELSGIYAHEINQPLAAIAAHSEAGILRLRRGRAAPQSAIGDFEQISIQAQRAGTIIKTLRSFLAKDPGETVAADLCVVVEAACRLVAAEARRYRVSVVINCPESFPLVLVEPAKIEHVLINLIRNAIEAIRDARMKKGTIRVTTSVTADNMACITVIDSGPGLDQLGTGTIFEPFNSTKTEGLGLGLVISRSLVEQAGGRLWAEAQRNAGVFHFTLPLAT